LCVVILFVQVENVDVVGAEPAQRFLRALDHPFARKPPLVWPFAANISELGGEHPVVALVADRAPDHLLGLAARVAVRRVDEIDALILRLGDDAACGRLVGWPPERHRAEAKPRDLDAAAAQIAILHGSFLLWSVF